MRMRRYLKATVALALVAALLSGTALAMGARVITPGMAVYNSSAQQVGVLGRGTSFDVTAINGGWARISYRGYTGYAQLSNMMFNKSIRAVTTTASGIRFMTRDSYAHGRYYTGTLAAGVPLYIRGIAGNYLLFLNTSGSVLGYIPMSAVRRV